MAGKLKCNLLIRTGAGIKWNGSSAALKIYKMQGKSPFVHLIKKLWLHIFFSILFKAYLSYLQQLPLDCGSVVFAFQIFECTLHLIYAGVQQLIGISKIPDVHDSGFIRSKV